MLVVTASPHHRPKSPGLSVPRQLEIKQQTSRGERQKLCKYVLQKNDMSRGKKPPSWKNSARRGSVLLPGFPTAAVETQGRMAE